MDKNGFLQRLFAMFPMNFNENNIQYWIEAYEAAFGNSRINYDKLFHFMIAEHNNMSSAPSPKWFKDNKSSAIEQDDRCEALKHIEEIKKDCVPPPPELKAKMAALKEKMGMK